MYLASPTALHSQCVFVPGFLFFYLLNSQALPIFIPLKLGRERGKKKKKKGGGVGVPQADRHNIVVCGKCDQFSISLSFVHPAR